MSGRTVWKYTIPVHVLSAMSTTVLHIPIGARLLHVAAQHGGIALWYEIPNPDAPKIQRGFQIFGTGTGPIDDHLTYVGTTMHAQGELVLHVYEIPRGYYETSKVEP
jgi:hypothetical protein